MLGKLTETMTGLLSRVAKQSKLTEENIAQAVEEVRIALLEADVNFGVVKKFVERVKAKALGADVVKAVSPGQQFTKVVHDELVVLMGGEEKQLDLKGSPSVVMLCGLQGSGKTTTAAKLAKFFSKRGKRPLLVACDLQRP
ncbi:MAG: signal recognition particle receptor subunit alpha, partial [Chlamydiia bacterium]|nr:signal recognition particle receptor subunit alpha [Chlamydiia bacterium]